MGQEVLKDNKGIKEEIDTNMQNSKEELLKEVAKELEIDKDLVLKVLEALSKRIPQKETNNQEELSLKESLQGNEINLKEKMSHLWGENLDTNLLLAQRAMSWLGILSTEKEYNPEEFLSKLVDLGSLLSEDKSFANKGESFGITREEALKKRSKLTRDKEFLSSLHNKGHLSHNEAVSTLNQLNAVIASK